MGWFLLVLLLVVASWWLWRQVDRGGTASGDGDGDWRERREPVRLRARIPASRIGPITGDVFTPEGVPFSQADALAAFDKFIRHIGWDDDAEEFRFMRDEFRQAMAENHENLRTSVEELGRGLADLLEELDFLGGDEPGKPADLDPGERALRARLKKERARMQRASEQAVEALQAFEADRRPFLVAYLQHVIHGRKRPVVEPIIL